MESERGGDRMRMTHKAAIYASTKKKPVALTVTKKQWTNRVAASALLNGGTVGHDSSNNFYALALTFTAPKNMKKLTMSFAGSFNDYQNGAQYRCGIASALPSNNSTTGTVFYTGTKASASTGKYYNMSATAENTKRYTDGTSYTLWIWTSGTPTGSLSYTHNTTITLEAV